MINVGDRVEYDAREWAEGHYFTGTIVNIYENNGKTYFVIEMDKDYHFWSENHIYIRLLLQ